MRKRITIVALTLTLPALAAAQAKLKVGKLTPGTPAQIGEIDTDRIKGQPSRLAWSADGSELYVQMMDGEFGRPGAKLSHHVFKLADKSRKEAPVEPDWASAYWTEKSDQASPDSPAFKIELKSETRTERTVAAPMGGDLARGGGVGGDGGSASSGDAIAAAHNQQRVPVHTMMLHGQIVGEYINSVIVPGQTFGWGPTGSHVIAYSAHKSGRLVIMDGKGARQEVDGTKDVVFPAWSPDGSRLAWLEKDGRKKYVLKTAKVE